jgi:hypothetical protein
MSGEQGQTMPGSQALQLAIVTTPIGCDDRYTNVPLENRLR